MSLEKRPVRKVNTHSHRVGGPWDLAKAQRRADAEARQASYDRLTAREKLAKLGAHVATKQRRLLGGQL
jgi:hypothetical protein